MATASRATRKLRRLRRERTLAFRMARTLQTQRDEVITLYNQLIQAQKESTAEPKPKSTLTITRLPDDDTSPDPDNPAQDNPPRGPNPDSDGLVDIDSGNGT